MKRSTKIGIVLGILCLAIGFVHYSAKKKLADNAHRIQAFILVNNEYFMGKAKNSDTWLLAGPPTAESGVERFVNENEGRVNRLLSLYGHCTPLAEKIVQTYSNRIITVCLDVNRSVTSIKFREQLAKHRPGTVEICFIPRNVKEKLGSCPTIFWRSDWGLMISSLNMSDTLLATFLFHELGHGIRHPISPNTPYYSGDSPAYAKEEVEMHMLGTAIINAATSNAFTTTINEIIVTRSQGVTDVYSFICSLTVPDFQKLDQVTGITGAGYEVSANVYTEYLMALGVEWLDHSNERGRGEPTEEKVRLFRWLNHNLFNQDNGVK